MAIKSFVKEITNIYPIETREEIDMLLYLIQELRTSKFHDEPIESIAIDNIMKSLIKFINNLSETNAHRFLGILYEFLLKESNEIVLNILKKLCDIVDIDELAYFIQLGLEGTFLF